MKSPNFEDIKNLHITGSALSISKNSREACYKAIKIAKAKNPSVLISFDPNLRAELLDLGVILKICKPVLEITDILFPSGEEAEILAGINEPVEACQILLENGPKIIVLKRGKRGCTIFTKNNPKGANIEGFKVNEVDPTGAGDSFGGAFIVGYLAGWNLKKTAKFANIVGAKKVKHFGPIPDTTYEEVIELLEKY